MVNGVYLEDGTSDGVPMYRRLPRHGEVLMSSTLLYRDTTDHCWRVRVRHWRLYLSHPDKHLATPPADGWQDRRWNVSANKVLPLSGLPNEDVRVKRAPQVRAFQPLSEDQDAGVTDVTEGEIGRQMQAFAFATVDTVVEAVEVGNSNAHVVLEPLANVRAFAIRTEGPGVSKLGRDWRRNRADAGLATADLVCVTFTEDHDANTKVHVAPGCSVYGSADMLLGRFILTFTLYTNPNVPPSAVRCVLLGARACLVLTRCV